MFNVEKATKGAIEWIRGWFDKNGKGCNAVIGISGGKDSSVVAALCVEALGKDRTIGVLMPNGEQSDIDCSKQLVAHLAIPYYICNVKQKLTIYEKHFNEHGCKPNVGRPPNLPE